MHCSPSTSSPLLTPPSSSFSVLPKAEVSACRSSLLDGLTRLLPLLQAVLRAVPIPPLPSGPSQSSGSLYASQPVGRQMSEEAASILVEARRAVGPMHPGMEGAGTVCLDDLSYLSIPISIHLYNHTVCRFSLIILYVGSTSLDSTGSRADSPLLL